MGQKMSSCVSKKPAKKPEKEAKFLKELKKILKNRPAISDEDWEKIATKSWKKMNKE